MSTLHYQYFGYIGRMLIVVGVVIVAIGLLLMYFSKYGLVGKLPGDIVIQKGSFVFYLPITSMLIVSIIATAISGIFFRR